MNQHWRKKKWRDARRRVEVEDVHVVDYHIHTHTHTHRMCRCVRESAPGGVARRNRLPSRIGSSCRCQAPGCCCCCVVLIPQQQQQRWPDSQSSPSRISTRELVAVPASAPRFQASRHQPSETFLPSIFTYLHTVRTVRYFTVVTMRVIHLASAFTSLASSGIAALSSHALLRPDVVRLHQSLVEIESISGHEQAVGDWLYHSLIQQGYHAEKQYVSRDPERFNVYAWPGENRDPPVMLTSHIDTV